MTSEEKAAYINAKTASTLCTMQAMIAFNQHRESEGHAQGYDEEAFLILAHELDDMVAVILS